MKPENDNPHSNGQSVPPPESSQPKSENSQDAPLSALDEMRKPDRVWAQSPAGDMIRDVIVTMRQEEAQQNSGGSPIHGADSPSVAVETNTAYSEMKVGGGRLVRSPSDATGYQSDHHAATGISSSYIARPGGFRRQHNAAEGTAEPAEDDFVGGLFNQFLYTRFLLTDPEEADDTDYVTEFQTRRLTVAAELRQAHRRILLAHPERRKRANQSHTVLNVMKSFIGSAFLFLPRAFMNGGMVFANAVMVASMILNTWCMMLLVKCCRPGMESYGEIAQAAFGQTGAVLVNFSLWLSQLGFFAVFYIFVGTNLVDLVESLGGCNPDPNAWTNWNVDWVIWGQVPIYCLFSFVRRIKSFGPYVLVADACIVISVLMIFGLVATELASDSPGRGPKPVTLFNEKSWPLFLGAAVYSWEGIGMLLPVRAAMQEHIKHKFPSILVWSLIGILSLFVSYASLAYWAYGDQTQDLILLNLPASVPGFSVQILYLISLVLGVPLLIFPAIKVIDQLMYPDSNLPPSQTRKWIKNFARVVQIAATAVVAIASKSQLDNFIAIIGSFAAVPLALIYPPLFHLRLTRGGFSFVKLLDILIVLLGLFLVGYTTFVAIEQWTPREVETRCSMKRHHKI